jgi:hypothetical protein
VRADALGALIVLAIFVGVFLQIRWNFHVLSARAFTFGRSAAIQKARNAGCIASIRVLLRWQKPSRNSNLWMSADLCVSGDELIVIPDLIWTPFIVSPNQLKALAYIVPWRRRTTTTSMPNPVQPPWRFLSRTGDRVIAISTDANCTAYISSRRPAELEVLLNAPATSPIN